MSKNDKGERKNPVVYVFCVVLVFICSCLGIGVTIQENENINTTETSQGAENNFDGELILTMIDCGQADSFYFEQNGMTALVDCGTTSTGKDVVNFLKEKEVSHLDYVFSTHPHDDHMGGMYDVITSFEVDNAVIPKVKSGQVTTNWYMKLMNELKNSKYNVVYPNVGDKFVLGNAKIEVLGPIEMEPDNLNNYSLILKISYGDMDVLMTGDAEKTVEKDLLASEANLDIEILKVGHHGSDTSSSKEFLDATTPEYALISCKVGNKYNHPNKSTVEELEERRIKVFRTDENGTVTLRITKNNVTYDKQCGDYLSGEELEGRLEK